MAQTLAMNIDLVERLGASADLARRLGGTHGVSRFGRTNPPASFLAGASDLNILGCDNIVFPEVWH